MLRAVRHLSGVAAFHKQAPKKFPLVALDPRMGSNLPGQLSPALLPAKGRASSTSGTRTAKPSPVSAGCLLALCQVWIGALSHHKDKAILMSLKKSFHSVNFLVISQIGRASCRERV